MQVENACATMQEGKRAGSCAERQARGRAGRPKRETRHGPARGASTFAVAAEPELVGATDKPVVSAIEVHPEGERVAKHQPDDGDHGGNREGLQSRRQNTLESGETTCKQKQAQSARGHARQELEHTSV